MLVLSLDDALVRKARTMSSVTTGYELSLQDVFNWGVFLINTIQKQPNKEILFTNTSAKKIAADYMKELVFSSHDRDGGLCLPDCRSVSQKKELPCSEGPKSWGSRRGLQCLQWVPLLSAPFGGWADCAEGLMGGRRGPFIPIRAMESLRAPLGNSLPHLRNLAAKLICNFP